MLKGVLFDMDGVLFDTERVYAEVEKQVAGEMDIPLTDDIIARMYGANGPAVSKIMHDAFGPDFDYEAFRTATFERVCANIERDGLPLKPGVRELLAWLREHGWKIALASSTRIATVRSYLGQAGLAHFFEAVVGGDMVAASKPAPDIFLAAANALGLPPAACAAIEDSVNGVNSAVAAGCVTLMVPDMVPPTDELRAKCAAVLPSLHEVSAFLREFNAAQEQ